MKNLIKTFGIAIAALSTSMSVLAQLPPRPDMSAIKRAVAGATPDSDMDIGEPVRVGKDTYLVQVVMSGTKCSVMLRPAKNSKVPGRMEMFNMQCEN